MKMNPTATTIRRAPKRAKHSLEIERRINRLVETLHNAEAELESCERDGVFKRMDQSDPDGVCAELAELAVVLEDVLLSPPFETNTVFMVSGPEWELRRCEEQAAILRRAGFEPAQGDLEREGIKLVSATPEPHAA